MRREMIDRAKFIRRDILEMSYRAQVGHIPSALSMVDYLMVAFERFVDPRRDRLVLGKPYGAQAYYATFAQRSWIEPHWDQYGSCDPSWTYIMSREHPLVTFIDDTMGNALSVACGVALSFPGLVFVNVSDAYLQAGSAWEAIMFAGFHALDNLLLTIDNNRMQVLGRTHEILDVEPLNERFTSFGWRVLRADGHDFKQIEAVYNEARDEPCGPTVLIFDTEKGHGIPFMVNDPAWHYRIIDAETLQRALTELK